MPKEESGVGGNQSPSLAPRAWPEANDDPPSPPPPDDGGGEPGSPPGVNASRWSAADNGPPPPPPDDDDDPGHGAHDDDDDETENNHYEYEYEYNYEYNYYDYGPWDYWYWDHNWWWWDHSPSWWFGFSLCFGDDFRFFFTPWWHHHSWYWYDPYRDWHCGPFSRHPWRYWCYSCLHNHLWYDACCHTIPTRYVTSYYPVTRYVEVSGPLEPVLPSIDEGWARLRDGRLEAAEGLFAELVYALPHEGAPRIGYAIASGLLHRDEAAISAMRRALIDQPDALFDVPDDALIHGQIRTLLDRYAHRALLDPADADSLFMVAALQFTLDEHAVAYFAIDAAMRAGDDDDSAYNLRLMLEDIMYESL
ncbi:MAG: hypothetical protein JSV91_10110 [Phycisphaerales bacterium]|nr:MAG: hypothetical protein JSV91_10110 [Phycisphaerales bacterium]